MFDTLTPNLPVAAGRPAASAVPRQGGHGRLLVFAPDSESPVFLADSESESEDEHLFRCADGVVRLPRSVAVAVRPVRPSTEVMPTPAAVRALRDAVASTRRPAAGGAASASELTRQLSAALHRGDGSAAFAFAQLLRHSLGLLAVYELLRRILAEVGEGWARGSRSVLAEHAVTSAATTVVELLRAGARKPGNPVGTVVVTSGPNDRHVLALPVLGHLLEEAGHRVHVVADLPLGELLNVAAQPGTKAVVVSFHAAASAASVHALVAALRSVHPGLKVAVGGPGLPRSTAFGRSCAADLVSSDPERLVELLVDRELSLLTARESEVLRAVADGLTNAEIAERLGIGSATVKSHLDSVLSKTSTDHRAAAVARALRAGWIT